MGEWCRGRGLFFVGVLLKLISIFLLAPLAPSPALAGRPLTVNDIETLPTWQLQIESGSELLFSSFKPKDFEVSFPTTLSVGISQRMELSVGTAFMTRHPALEVVRAGVTDLAIGTKFKLLDQARWRPGFAVSAEAGLPVGSRKNGLNPGKVTTELHVIATKRFGPISTHGTLGWLYQPDPDERMRGLIHGGLAMEWPAINWLTVVAEIHGSTAEAKGGPPLWVGGAGIKILLLPTLTMDVGWARGLFNRAGPHVNGSLGLTYSFPIRWFK